MGIRTPIARVGPKQARRLRRLFEALVLTAWLLLGGGALAGPAGSPPSPLPPVVEVGGGEGRLALAVAALLLEDPSGQLDFASVRALPVPRWQRPATLPISLGYSRSVWWLRVRLHNAGDTGLDRRFAIGSPLQDYIDLWVVHGSGAVQQFPRMGDRVPFTERLMPNTNPTVPMRMAPKETIDVYLRLSTHDGLYEQLPLTLWTLTAFREDAQWHWFGSGLYCGVVGLLLLYSSLLFTTTRYRGFALYAFYLCAQMLWHTVFSGDAFYLLWPNSPVFNNQVLLLAIGAVFLTVSLFLSSYVRLRERLPRCDRVLLGCGIASGVASLGSLLGSYAATYLLTMLFGLMWVVGFHACALWLSLTERHRQATWMLVAWLPLSSTVVAYTAEVCGVALFANLPALHGALQAASASQLLLLGLGVAFDVGRLRQEKFDAERAARLAHEHLALRLESEVQQRTQALEIANTRLREMSLTDALTGLSNRRHFNELLESELARQHRQGETPALCLLDVDHFKGYNDLHGHQQGDAALVAIAQVLQQKLRRAGDRAFRVGGEEFALLLLPEEGQSQRCYVDTIRAAIEALAMPHPGNPAGVVTASFGLVQMPPVSAGAPVSAAAIYREADRLLYLAKEAGRNRVMSDTTPVGEWAPAAGSGAAAAPSPLGVSTAS